MITDLVTIAIPVYERIDYFEEALNSALNQTVHCPIVVVDNGSSHDLFREICLKHQNRVRFYKNEKNMGMFYNWNKCAEYCKTKYFVILGDDDIMAPGFVEAFLDAKKKYKDIIGQIRTSYNSKSEYRILEDGTVYQKIA